MGKHHDINTYIINKDGTFRRVDQLWSNDTLTSASLMLNSGWQDGLLPDVDSKWPFLEARFWHSGDTPMKVDNVTTSGWGFDIVINNAEVDIINHKTTIPESYCTVVITDPFGIEERYKINPTIEAIAERYKMFCALMLTESFSKASYQLRLAKIEEELEKIVQEVSRLKGFLATKL